MCPSPPASPADLALPASFLVFTATSVITLFQRRSLSGQTTGFCGNCKYDLGGLCDDARCPECGSELRETTNASFKVMLAWRRLPAWLFGVAVTIAFLWLSQGFLIEIVVRLYESEGFSETTARHVIPLRELRQGALPLLAPLIYAAGFLPLLARIHRRQLACLSMVIALAAALAVSVLIFDAGA